MIRQPGEHDLPYNSEAGGSMRSPAHTTDAPPVSESSPGRENGVGLPAGTWQTPAMRELTDYEATQFIREQLGVRPPCPEDFSADGRYLLPRSMRNR